MKKTTLDPDRKITVQISDDSELELQLKRIMAPPGQKISLRKDYDPSFTADFKNKKAAQKKPCCKFSSDK